MHPKNRNKPIELSKLVVKKPIEFFDEQNIDALVHSIAANGLINLPTVTPSLEVIDGCQRLVALHRLGIKQIKIHYFSTERDGWAWALVHSPTRSMHPLETAYTYVRASEHFTRKQLEVFCTQYRQRKYAAAFTESGLKIRNWSPT